MNTGTDPRRGLPAVDRLAASVRGASTPSCRPGLPWPARAPRSTRPAAPRPAGAPNRRRSMRSPATRRAPRPRARRPPPAPRRERDRRRAPHQPRPRGPRAAAPATPRSRPRPATAISSSTSRAAGAATRLAPLGRKLGLLAGCEAALAVNNNAAALLLAVATLARGREVVVSRGELVEIGGSFRLPDILEAAGVRLVEVGTTNRTHPEDYRRALRPETGAAAEGAPLQLRAARLRRRGRASRRSRRSRATRGVPLARRPRQRHARRPARARPARGDLRARDASRLGVDVVCFSGDKLLGGPQAGILLGSARRIDAMRQASARARAATRQDGDRRARLDRRGDARRRRVRRRCRRCDSSASRRRTVERRARSLASLLDARVVRAGLQLEVVESRAPVGGGSLPGFELPSWAVAIRDANVAGRGRVVRRALARRARAGRRARGRRRGAARRAHAARRRRDRDRSSRHERAAR